MTAINLDLVNKSFAATKQHEPNPSFEQASTQGRKAKISEQKSIIATIVLAFSGDPAARWMYPNPHQYLTYFPRFVEALGGKAFVEETAYCIEDYSGAALWFPPGVELDVEPIIELIEQSISKSEQADVFAVFEQMGYYHPQQPHWYLPIIGVKPNQQGKGYGSALIHQVLKHCDQTHTPAYLEASKPANVDFYQRHGFEILSRIQCGGSPPIFPMVRYPHF